MENKNFEELLDKYWNAETTLEEERKIRKYLSENNDNEYNPVKTLFGFYEAESKIIYSGELNKNKSKSKVIKWNFNNVAAVAASVVLLVSAAGLYFYNTYKAGSNHEIFAGEVNDPDEALKITRQALAILSENYDKAGKSIAAPIEKLEKLEIIKSN